MSAHNIKLDQLRRSPFQLRVVKKESLDYIVLRDSIRDLGILQSLLVRPVESGYEVIAGNHRYEVAKDLRLLEVPCIIRTLTDEEAIRAQVVENSNRIVTKPIDYCRRLQRIIHTGEMTIEELAFSIHRHVDWVSKLLSLNHLSKNAKKLLDKRQISCIISIELAKLPISEQDRLLSLKADLSKSQYLELVRSAVRNYREGGKHARLQRGYQLSLRHYSAIKNEYLNRIEKATVLLQKGAQNTSDGWDAAFEWILQCDEASLRRRAVRTEQDKRRESRTSELRNLELKRRKDEHRIDDIE